MGGVSVQIAPVGIPAASVQEVVPGDQLLKLVLHVGQLLSGELELTEYHLGLAEVLQVRELAGEQE